MQSNPIIDIVHNPFGESSNEQSAFVARRSHDRNSQFDNFEINPPEVEFEPMLMIALINPTLSFSLNLLNKEGS